MKKIPGDSLFERVMQVHIENASSARSDRLPRTLIIINIAGIVLILLFITLAK